MMIRTKPNKLRPRRLQHRLIARRRLKAERQNHNQLIKPLFIRLLPKTRRRRPL
jgi:hypothetical protein